VEFLLTGLFMNPLVYIIILIIALLIFGKRLPEVARSLGKGIVEFKKGVKGIEDDIDRPLPPPQQSHGYGQGYGQYGQSPQAGQTGQQYSPPPYSNAPYGSSYPPASGPEAAPGTSTGSTGSPGGSGGAP